jgi:hypothetical protein
MSEQTNNSGRTPAGGSPGEPAGNTGGSFVRSRVAQMEETMRPAPGAQPAADQRSQAQTPPAEQKIKVGDAEYSAADVQSAIAGRAEAQVRRSALPSAPEGYEAKLPPSFQAPPGVTFEFDAASPELARARAIAHAQGLSQETFSELLGCFAATQINGQMQQQQLREKNLAALGAAGPARIAAVSQWLAAKAGKDGAVVADFIQKFPSAPLVRSLENVIRAFSHQGGADFSQSHRANQAEEGKIPGYENMSFVQRRVAQHMLNSRKPPERR